MVIFNIFQVSSNLVGGFNPSEKYESVGMMTFPIYGKIKAMFQSPPTSNYMQLSDFLIHWNWGSPIFSPCTAGHSRAQLGRLLLALVPSLQHDAFQAGLMGLQTLLSGPGLGRNQDLDLEPHGKYMGKAWKNWGKPNLLGCDGIWKS